jgi:hypothetical protein
MREDIAARARIAELCSPRDQVRHEALSYRMEVQDLHRLAIVVAG